MVRNLKSRNCEPETFTAGSMKIFLTNDDGYKAEGIKALYRVLSTNHQVTLIAPDREKSAVSHGISLNSPLRIERVVMEDQHPGYAVNGTPADCVKLGLFQVFKTPPDLLVSGINAGANLGIDINYSGTASAAREGTLNRIPSLAVSLMKGQAMDFKGLARFIAQMIEKWQDFDLPIGTFLNINGPDLPMDKTQGVKITRQSLNNLSWKFDQRIDPKGRPYYWYGGENNGAPAKGTDVHALLNNHISITPIQCDMTCDQGFTCLEAMAEHL